MSTSDFDKKYIIYCKDCIHFWEHTGECHLNPLYAKPKLDHSYCSFAEKANEKVFKND